MLLFCNYQWILCVEWNCVGTVDFNDSLPVVTEAVNHAEFLAVDAEFSGLFVYLLNYGFLDWLLMLHDIRPVCFVSVLHFFIVNH